MNSNRGSPFKPRGGGGKNYQRRNDYDAGGGDDTNVEEFMTDFKEKRKLLVRWPTYFPHENVKEFDVR